MKMHISAKLKPIELIDKLLTDKIRVGHKFKIKYCAKNLKEWRVRSPSTVIKSEGQSWS